MIGRLKSIALVPLIAFIWVNTVVAQQNPIDSLKKELKTQRNDTLKCTLLDQIIELENDDAIWPKYNERLLQLTNKNLKKKLSKKEKYIYLSYKARALNNQSLFYNMQGNVPMALQSIKQSLKILRELKRDVDIALALNTICGIYMDLGNFEEALKYQTEAYDIRILLNDSLGLAQTLGNLGVIYNNVKGVNEGLKYYRKSLAMRLRLKDDYGSTSALNNIGFAYLELAKAEKDSKIKNQHLDTALYYYDWSLKVESRINSQRGICYSYHNMATVYIMKNDYKKAKALQLKAHDIAIELNYPEPLKRTSVQLCNIYTKEENYKEAFRLYKIFIKMRDSLSNEDAKRAAFQNQLQTQYDKKMAADSIKRNEEKKLMAAEQENEKFQRFVLYGGLALTFLFAMFMLNRFRLVRKQRNLIREQKQEVELQKHRVDEKQREVMDSIHYAKRIQQALMPTEKAIEKRINEIKNKK